MPPTNFKKATSAIPGDAAKYSAPEYKNALDILDGTHATERVQLQNIEGYVPAFDVVVYQKGGVVYARRANGTVLYSGTANSGVNDITAIDTACNVAVVDGKATSVLIKPGTYTGNGTSVNITIVSGLTLVGYGATIKYVAASPSSTYFLFNTGATVGAFDVNIFGLTVDCNTLCQGMRFSGADSNTKTVNVRLEDCTFKNIYNSYLLLFTYSIPTSSNPVDIPTGKNMDVRVTHCTFLAGDTSNCTNTFPLVHFINTRNFILKDCIFEGHTSTNQAACASSLYSEYGVIANNVFRSSAAGEVRDLLLQQSRKIVIASNKFTQKFLIQDCRSINVGGGNRINQLKLIDKDEASTADSHPALFRSTRYLLIANNTFDTVPIYDGQNFDSAIEIDASDNDTNSPKHITITENIIRCRVSFIDLIAALPNAAAGGAIEDIMISNNVVTERTSTSSNQAIVNLTANTTLTAHGLTRLFVIGNYFCLKHASSPAINDIGLGGTGFTNVVIRKNYLSNEGINNASSYTTLSRNYGDATTRRDFNSGIASITTGSFIDVTHGLQYTPVVQDIYVVPTTSLGAASSYWVSAVTSTTFTITINTAATPSFAWRVGRIA